MGKLKMLPPRLKTLAPRLGYLPGDEQARDKHRAATQHWRKWYSTAKWQALRLDVFTRDMFTCRWPGCGRIEGNTTRLVCDHVQPHRGDERLFWDKSNLQTLCKPCHDKHKQALERRHPSTAS